MDSTTDEMNVESVMDMTTENDEDLIDDTPEFIESGDAVEVQVDDTDVPMDDDDDVEELQTETSTTASETVVVVDMSKAKVETHTDSVYTVACVVENGHVSILSGGGDDKAFLHKLSGAAAAASSSSSSSSSSQPLAYPHTDTVSCVAFNMAYVSDDPQKTPRLAAVGSYDGSIILYDPDTAEQKLKLEGPSDVEWLAFHPKGGSVLLAGSGDGTVWMFHIPLNRCLQVFVGHEQAVTAGGFSPDGKWALSTSADGTVRIWAPKTGMNKHVFRFKNSQGGDGASLTCMATNGGSDGMMIMVGGEDGQAHVCHVGTKKVVASLRHFEPPATTQTQNNDDQDDDEEMEYPMSVEAVGFSPMHPNMCATGGVDGRLKIWDLSKDGQCRHTCAPPANDENSEGTDSITRLRWHPSLPVLFTTTISGKVRVWDARNGGLLHTLTGHTEMINDMDIQFLNDSGIAVIVSAGDDKTVRVFELDVNAILQQAASAAMQ